MHSVPRELDKGLVSSSCASINLRHIRLRMTSLIKLMTLHQLIKGDYDTMNVVVLWRYR